MVDVILTSGKEITLDKNKEDYLRQIEQSKQFIEMEYIVNWKDLEQLAGKSWRVYDKIVINKNQILTMSFY